MSTTREVLASLLASECGPQEAAQAVWDGKLEEDQWLDYKSGKLVSSKNARTLRSLASGFANAAGGLIVVGIDEEDRKPTMVDGVSPVGSEPADGWVSHALGDLLPFLGSAPVVAAARLEGKDVVVVAVNRAPNLVPVYEGGIKHYIRIGDKTPPVPSYLYADLAMGRRARPTLRVDASHEVSVNAGSSWRISTRLTVLNDGLVWVPRMQIGCVGAGQPNSLGEKVLQPTTKAIKRRMRALQDWPTHVQVSREGYGAPFAPMEQVMVDFHFDVPSAGTWSDPRMWAGMAYVLPDNGPPVFHRLHVDFHFSGGLTPTPSFRFDSSPLLDTDRADLWSGTVSGYIMKKEEARS